MRIGAEEPVDFDAVVVGAGFPNLFLVGGFGVYRQTCDEVAARGYEGLRLTAPSPGSRPRSGGA
jgi:hypothetical protein